MKHIIYSSLANPNTTLQTLEDILTEANIKNRENGITGLLVYNGIYFLQCIEGREKDVDRLFCNIQRDPRHKSIKLIGEQKIVRRVFPQWSIGFVGRSKRMSKTILSLTGNITFNPPVYEYKCAKRVLNTLSELI